MGQKDSEFAKLLETFLSKTENFGVNQKYNSAQSNVNNAQILFMEVDTKKPTGKYPHQPLKSRPVISELALNQSDLLPKAQMAFKSFQMHGAQLNESFCLSEVKAEWRKLAFTYHPDTNPGEVPNHFGELLEAYQTLKFAFKSLQQAA